MSQLIAAADIGSNTAHLLIAHVTSRGLKRLVNESEWLSLGETVARTGEIPFEDEKRLFATVRRFMEMITAYKVAERYFFATEAVRRASNHAAVLEGLRSKLGVEVEIISPRREAELSLRAIGLDCPGPDPTLMVEAGGGSVQVAFCEGPHIRHEASLPIGTGALKAAAGLTLPASQEQVARLRARIAEASQAVADYPRVARIVAAGGVARGLWRAMHPDGDRTLQARELEFLAWDCQRLTREVTAERYDVKLNRAGTLLSGSFVFLEVMRLFGLEEMTVSQYGVREGAVLEMAARREESWIS